MLRTAAAAEQRVNPITSGQGKSLPHFQTYNLQGARHQNILVASYSCILAYHPNPSSFNPLGLLDLQVTIQAFPWVYDQAQQLINWFRNCQEGNESLVPPRKV